jgi:kynurenine formamidase
MRLIQQQSSESKGRAQGLVLFAVMYSWKTLAIGLSLALALFLFAQRRAAMTDAGSYNNVVDLTHELNDHSPNWEGTDESPFHVKETGTIEHDGYYVRSFRTEEHYGTHIDAPAHFGRGMWTVDRIPVERLVRPLVVLDVHDNAAAHPDYEISVKDIADWERRNGEIPSGAVVMAYTGWDEHWSSPKAFRNAGADGVMHFPGYSLEAAMFLVKTRNVVALGIDTMSIDPGASKMFPVHHFTANASVYQLENVANLRSAPASGATIVVAPIKLEDGSGGPARLLALVK